MDQPCILYAAASLDGYLAEADGGIGFLEEIPQTPADLGYDAFYAAVGTLVMGGKTYRQLTQELSPGAWPYAGKPCYVYTRSQTGHAEKGVTFTAEPPAQLLARIRSRHTRGAIWLVGGGEIVRLFLRQNLIDEYRIYLMPTLLGEGLPLFPQGFSKANLALHSATAMGDVAELIYKKRG